MFVSGEIRELAYVWKQMQKSDVAMRGEDLDALREMKHEELVRLAWQALNCIQRTEQYAYLISGLEAHVEGPGNHYEGWVISQSDGGDNAGGFNKWTKTLGGYAPESGPSGDALVYFTWKDARAAWDHFKKNNPEIAYCFRIYPVVITAGNEPRTTKPMDEQ